jgi:hypothetical protein
MLFALFVLKSTVGDGGLIFDIASIAIVASIAAHGLTDTSAPPGSASGSLAGAPEREDRSAGDEVRVVGGRATAEQP